MLSKIVRSKYYFPVLACLVIGTEAYYGVTVQNRFKQLEEKLTSLPPHRTEEEAVRAFAGKLRLCELACYGQVKKFSESTDTCECMEKSLDQE